MLMAIGIVQSFLDSQSSHSMAIAEIQTPDFCCPCSGFLGWKQIRLGGKKLSKSYSDLRLLGRGHPRGWAWDEAGSRSSPRADEEKKSTLKPTLIEKLPNEVLGKCPALAGPLREDNHALIARQQSKSFPISRSMSPQMATPREM
jgi:hypothetical protein